MARTTSVNSERGAENYTARTNIIRSDCFDLRFRKFQRARVEINKHIRRWRETRKKGRTFERWLESPCRIGNDNDKWKMCFAVATARLSGKEKRNIEAASSLRGRNGEEYEIQMRCQRYRRWFNLKRETVNGGTVLVRRRSRKKRRREEKSENLIKGEGCDGPSVR